MKTFVQLAQNGVRRELIPDWRGGARRTLCAFGFLSVAMALSTSFALGDEALEKSAQDPNQWVLPLGSYGGIRHSTLTQINTKNAGKLKVAWTMSTGTLRGQEGQPLVVGNMMYFESSYPNYVYAVNLDDVGKIVWKFAPEQDKFAPSVACCDVVNRGVAMYKGHLFLGALDGRLISLDAKTGGVAWEAQTTPKDSAYAITGAPRIANGLVVIGNAG